MCGICGVYNYKTRTGVAEELLWRMSRVLEHRGPDDAGVISLGPLGLAHRRLSIIDVAGGHQPMSNEDGSVWLVFNGEIYNFPELRQQLEGLGHIFRTRADTEVLVHLYEEEGVECLARLRGMFAFALWDGRAEQLLLARDRLGQKPLVYTLTRYGLAFASEIKALLEWEEIPRRVNVQALHNYLTYQYVPAPETIFEGIYKLPPAHYLVCRKGEVEVERYWRLSFRYSRLSLAEYEARIREELREATRLRLISDVPLGAFLSGGIDSSAVVATMAELVDQPVRTFSIGFEEEEFNELEYAREVAKMYGTRHEEFVVRTEAKEVLPKLVWHYNEPFADPSAIPSYYVAKMARRHVTVALNGDAGDESFAGYERYVADWLAGLYLKLPQFMREKLIPALLSFLPVSPYEQALPNKLRRFLDLLSSPYAERYARLICAFSEEEKRSLYTPQLLAELDGADSLMRLVDLYAAADAPDVVGRALFVDMFSYLPDDLLVKIDIATMANSLEARSPFLDHKFIEFAATIPGELKLRHGQTKYILRRALRPLLPGRILRRKKAGFSVPIAEWFRGELRNFVYDLLLDKRTLARGYFRPEALTGMLEEHTSGRRDHAFRIFTLLNLELWHRIFIDRKECYI